MVDAGLVPVAELVNAMEEIAGDVVRYPRIDADAFQRKFDLAIASLPIDGDLP